jgi:hypothetical protein
MTTLFKKFLSLTLVATLMLGLLSACNVATHDHEGYIKTNYSLSGTNGSGSNFSKTYLASGLSVTQVASAVKGEESPSEISKSSEDKMVLLYYADVVTITKGLEGSKIEIDSLDYIHDHDSEMTALLAGYLAADLLGNLMQDDYHKTSTPKPKSKTVVVKKAPTAEPTTKPPTTSSGSGTFTKKGDTSSSSTSKKTTTPTATKKPSSPTDDSTNGTVPSTSSGSGTFTKKGSTSNSSTPKTTSKPRSTKKSSSSSSSTPKTSSKSGTFTKK